MIYGMTRVFRWLEPPPFKNAMVPPSCIAFNCVRGSGIGGVKKKRPDQRPLLRPQASPVRARRPPLHTV